MMGKVGASRALVALMVSPDGMIGSGDRVRAEIEDVEQPVTKGGLRCLPRHSRQVTGARPLLVFHRQRYTACNCSHLQLRSDPSDVGHTGIWDD